MSHGKQFTLYSHASTPNGWKVEYVLRELGLEYEPVYLKFQPDAEHKQPPFLKINPNGRIPALIDHKNNDFAIWESDAILFYLSEKYDPEKKISPTTENDKFLVIQWLFFQASGQGPYFGQYAWFNHFHPEKIPSAVERYKNEAVRVFGVLDSVLKDREWLVGDKATIADISFIPWNDIFLTILTRDYKVDVEKEFPSLYKWHTKLIERPAIKEALALKAELTKAASH